MKKLPAKLFEVRDLTTSIPVTPAAELCSALSYQLDWVEYYFSEWGLHRIYYEEQLQLSYYQASLFARGILNPNLGAQHQQSIDQSFFAHFVHQNPKLHG